MKYKILYKQSYNGFESKNKYYKEKMTLGIRDDHILSNNSTNSNIKNTTENSIETELLDNKLYNMDSDSTFDNYKLNSSTIICKSYDKCEDISYISKGRLKPLYSCNNNNNTKVNVWNSTLCPNGAFINTKCTSLYDISSAKKSIISLKNIVIYIFINCIVLYLL